ncbi:hypothetical protein [Flavobacterium sp. AED]|uniref:hypothetical protein n=1 Tax=Flavobacterium sp. AED TaxID=1423323 RepID=UPI00057C8C40|nr:hypothetical protein [Flavobacterium sp. AED]KIA85242.1 hypothetical protein OA85_12660 [Flavobacterium sp. AED]
MKNFLSLFAKILLTTLLLLVVLDFIYTAVYLQSKDRGKIDYVYNSKGRSYDVVILGSSRANNHFVSQMFEEKGLKTFNYGMSGSRLFESDLLLKLMIERHYKIKNIIIEVDLNIASDGISESTVAKVLPYIHHSKTIREHLNSVSNFNAFYYIPFYRYVAYEPQIGFREMVLSLIRKKSAYLKNGGYYALNNEGENLTYDLSNYIPHQNKSYEEIKHICKANKINLIAVMTPMCTNTKGLDYFEKVHQIYPEIYNYENAVEGDQYFSSCGHLNDAGARKFTAIIIRFFFNR